jgi:hypothetical protein
VYKIAAERGAVPNRPQLVGGSDHRPKPSRAAEPVVAAAKIRNGSTVLRFADRSTITLAGVDRFDELTLFAGGRLRALRRVV